MLHVKHYPPRRKATISRRTHNIGLGVCFLATIVFMVILFLVATVFGQTGHLFPFKTLSQITEGTVVWTHDAPPRPQGTCTGGGLLPITKYHLVSPAGSLWVIYTDGLLFAAAYFPPSPVPVPPIVVVTGRIVDGTVILETNEDYDDAKHRPCDRWQKKSA